MHILASYFFVIISIATIAWFAPLEESREFYNMSPMNSCTNAQCGYSRYHLNNFDKKYLIFCT